MYFILLFSTNVDCVKYLFIYLGTIRELPAYLLSSEL